MTFGWWLESPKNEGESPHQPSVSNSSEGSINNQSIIKQLDPSGLPP